MGLLKANEMKTTKICNANAVVLSKVIKSGDMDYRDVYIWK